jgi:23S rRNA (guanine745-N1)-methyltransferase
VVTLVCPVRGCGAPLARESRRLACRRGHSFDLARSGYCNLLQPQDRRSRQPGDSPAAVAARRRLFDRGHGDWLLPHLLAIAGKLGAEAGAAVLDVGCGEGFYLGSLAERCGCEAHGLDISVAAIDQAARRWPRATWVVANADRFLPYEGGSFRLATCLTARFDPLELQRVLGAPPDASPPSLLVAVPGADDLVELRAAVLGEGHLRNRLATTVTALAEAFELTGSVTVSHRLHLGADDLRDLLAATYRGARGRQRERAASLTAMTVTVSRDLAWFRPRPPAPAAAGRAVI